MSNVIPIVSSSPPPLEEDVPGFDDHVEEEEEEDFGGFATAPSTTENTFKPIPANPTDSFAAFGSAEPSNGVEPDSDWAADFGSFSSGPPPIDLTNGGGVDDIHGDQDDDFSDFHTVTFQDTHASKLSHTTDSSTDDTPAANPEGLQNGVTSASPDVTSPASESASPDVTSPASDEAKDNSSSSLPTVESPGSDVNHDVIVNDVIAPCSRTTKSDSQDNTSQGSVTDSGLSSDISPGPKHEDFAEFAAAVSSSPDSADLTPEDEGEDTAQEDTAESSSPPAGEEAGGESAEDGSKGEPSPLDLRPSSFIAGDDSDTFQDDDSGTFGQFSDFAKPGGGSGGGFDGGDSESDAKLSDQFPGDSDSQREEDSEFEEFKKSGDSAEEGAATPSDCDKTKHAVPSADTPDVDDFSDFQDSFSNNLTEDSATKADDSETKADDPETLADGSQTIEDASESQVDSSETRTDESETRTDESETRTDESETRTDESETKNADSETKTEESQAYQTEHVEEAAGDVKGENADENSDESFDNSQLPSTADLPADLSKFEPPPMPDDDDDEDDDFADFADFKSSSAAVEPTGDEFASFKSSSAETAPEDDGWAAFGSSEPVKPADDEDGDDDWAAFGDAKAPAESSATDTKADDNDEEEDDDDDFGDFGDHTTTVTAPAFATPVLTKSKPVTVEATRLALSSCFPQMANEDDEYTIAASLLRESLHCEVLRKQEPDIQQAKMMGMQQKSKTVSVDINVWTNIRDLENTAALKYVWSASHHSHRLLRSLGIDTRNILMGHKKTSMPIFATQLGMLEPTRGVERSAGVPMSPLEPELAPVVKTTTSSAGGSSTGTPQQDIPPAEFDWSSAGLTNPLDASSSLQLDLDFFVKQDSSICHRRSRSEALEKEQEILSALEPARSDPPPKVLQPLDALLGTLGYQSTQPETRGKPADLDYLTPEASKLLTKLPDLSFMRSRMLMFPLRGATD